MCPEQLHFPFIEKEREESAESGFEKRGPPASTSLASTTATSLNPSLEKGENEDVSPEPPAPPDSHATPPRLPQPPHLTTVSSISCGMPARWFFELVKAEKVDMLVDTRLSTEYRDAKFAFGDDLAYVCERLGVEYHRQDDLAPTKELRSDLHKIIERKSATQDDRARAWTAFLKGYLALMNERKILAETSALHRLLYGGHKNIAFMCACQHHMDCHRRVLTGVLGHFIPGIEVRHLSPKNIDLDEPSLKSPRRYLLEDLPTADIIANPPRGWRS